MLRPGSGTTVETNTGGIGWGISSGNEAVVLKTPGVGDGVIPTTLGFAGLLEPPEEPNSA
jgi:hypothetical protein